MTSYQGRWNGVRNSHARLSARAGAPQACRVRGRGSGTRPGARPRREDKVGDELKVRGNARHAKTGIYEHRPPEELVHRVPGTPVLRLDSTETAALPAARYAGTMTIPNPAARAFGALEQPPMPQPSRTGHLRLDPSGDRDHQPGQDRAAHADPATGAGEPLIGTDKPANAEPPNSTQPTARAEFSVCHTVRGAVRAKRDDAEQAEDRGEPIDVTARDDLPEQQRVHRPQQVGAQPHSRIRPQQPVEDQQYREEGESLLYLQPERDPGQRGPARQARRPAT